MSSFHHYRTLIILLGASTVAAGLGCSGPKNSGVLYPPDEPIALIEKADVLRELRNINYFVAFGDGEPDQSSPTGQRGSWQFSSPMGASRDSGSLRSSTGFRQRDFLHFPFSGNVDYVRSVVSSCRNNSLGPESVSLDGVYEEGTVPSREFGYQIAGENGEALMTTIVQDGVTFYQSALGTTEYRFDGSRSEVRMIARSTFSHSGGSEIVGEFGLPGLPFVETDGGGQYLVEGPYRYTSTECAGGAATVATEIPLIIDGGRLTGGRLRFRSGNTSALVEIQGDGSAIISFSRGASAYISEEELSHLYSSFDTDCVSPPPP